MTNLRGGAGSKNPAKATVTMTRGVAGHRRLDQDQGDNETAEKVENQGITTATLEPTESEIEPGEVSEEAMEADISAETPVETPVDPLPETADTPESPAEPVVETPVDPLPEPTETSEETATEGETLAPIETPEEPVVEEDKPEGHVVIPQPVAINADTATEPPDTATETENTTDNVDTSASEKDRTPEPVLLDEQGKKVKPEGEKSHESEWEHGKQVKPEDEKSHESEQMQKPTPEPVPVEDDDHTIQDHSIQHSPTTVVGVKCTRTDSVTARVCCLAAHGIHDHLLLVVSSLVLLAFLIIWNKCSVCKRRRDDRGEYRAVAAQYGEMLAYDNTFDENYSFAGSVGSAGSDGDDDEDDWSSGAKIEMSAVKAAERNGGLSLEEMNG